MPKAAVPKRPGDDPKQALRQDAARRRAAAARAKPAAATDLCQAVVDFVLAAAPEFGLTVAGYWPMGSEIDPRPLMERLAGAGLRLCLPVTPPKGQPLAFRLWHPGDEMTAARFGTHEPLPEAPVTFPDILLVPLLLFDRKGHRLGYGQGYYDRTLADLRARRAVLAVGLAYAEQEAPLLPATPHDQPLDAIATDRGIIRI